MTSFSDHLHSLAEPIWRAQHEHPFVRGIGDGTLDVETFKLWLRQDYLFLIDYARVLSHASTRAPDLDTTRRFGDLAHETLNVEMDLHRSYAAEFGITSEELESETKLPTTQAYTDFLVRTATAGEYHELIAALLPCIWGYCEIGQRLAENRRLHDDARPDFIGARYAKWIEMYSSSEFADLADWCRTLTDRIAADASDASRTQMEHAFITCSRYEWLFWQMAWTNESWPV
ncbi:MAG: thiaminase II [Chloroflexi bacterium]|nr:thiaminase II [Chloroflexota bacterium]